MSKTWTLSKQKICGFSCLEHYKTKQLTLFGKYGELWPNDSHEFRAIIYSPRIARKYLSSGESIQGDTLIRFKYCDFEEWTARLLVPKKASTQLLLANEIKSKDDADEVKNE